MIWVDAHLPFSLAGWIKGALGQPAASLRELGLRDAEDEQIFAAARAAGVIVLTKDADFVALVERLGPPPQILWVTCGNTSNAALRRILIAQLPVALSLLDHATPVVEISG